MLLVLTGVSVAFPASPNDVDIELWYDGTWNNINQYVYHRSMTPIVITRGRTAEGRHCDPGSMTLEINNRDGRFSPKNPHSPLFGKIGRNTPIRTKVTYDAVTYVRFTGEVTSWPSRRDVSGRDIWVPIEAQGILRRLGQGTKPLRSPVYRAVSGVAPGDYVPQAYWPMEDGPTATRFASGLANGPAMTFSGEPDLASNGLIVGSDLLPTFSASSRAFASVPDYTDTDNFWVHQWFLYVPSDLNGQTGLTVFTAKTSSASVRTINVVLDLSGSNESITVTAYSSTGATTASFVVPAIAPADLYDQWVSVAVHHYIDTVAFIGDTFVGLHMLNMDGEFLYTNSVLISGSAAYGKVTDVGFNGGLAPVPAGLDGAGYGHSVVFVDGSFELAVDDAQHAIAGAAHPGEETDDRFGRICTQVGVPYTIVGESSTLMGPEQPGKFLEVLRSVEAAEQGFMFEDRESLGLKLLTNSARYGQIPIALDYDVGHISPPFDPEPDDRTVANDREVKRRNGSWARRELTSGPLSVQDPPDGVGRYDDSITLDVASDDQLDDIANWRLHIGTWDAERYPRVRVDLSANFGQNTALIPLIAAADSGSLITIDNLPADLPPETCELLVEGYREVIGFYDWDFTFNCSPAGAYNVIGVWELMSHELHTSCNDSTTSLDIANTDVSQPMLATTGLGSGYPVKIGGETLQITAVAASTITGFTGSTAAHADNASVTPALSGSLAQGNLILVLAAIRNSGTGVPNTPATYTRLPVFPATSNVQVFAKIAGASETDPTITFTGGVAGATTSAQTVRLAGKWHDVDNILVASEYRTNPSAQNITYPQLHVRDANSIVVWVAWKADDWTSVTGPGTEIGEPDTTTGDDQGIAWYHSVQTTATPVAGGAIVVTGGGAAPSKAATFALRCDYQTVTATRGINGAAASHTAGDAVTAVDPHRWALV